MPEGVPPLAQDPQQGAQAPMASAPWATVLAVEHGAINRRREAKKRNPVAPSATVDGKAYGESGQFDTLGLALSGGGIRSAAYCLGAVQALAEHKMFDCVDYLSTVSGGGYTGSAITSAMSLEGGKFPFKGEDGDLKDPDALGHIRDHSNYLIPRGKASLLEDFAIVARGLVANVLLAAPVILLLAALTIVLNPTLESLSQPLWTWQIFSGQFAVTTVLAIAGFVLFSAWAVYRSVFKIGESELDGQVIWGCKWILPLLGLVAFCELQPVVVKAMYDTVKASDGQAYKLSDWVTLAIKYLTPVIAVVSLYAKRIGEFLQHDSGTNGIITVVKRLAGKALVWAVALALPVLLWMFYLMLVYWGVLGGLDISWLWKIWFRLHLPASTLIPPFALVYAVLALSVMLLVWRLLSSNANSLHRLYRDRLSVAFLAKVNPGKQLHAQTMKVTDLDPAQAPYHLINAALNIQGSPQANRRGRNAEFFFFSPIYSGSEMSCLLPTASFESEDPALSLGTAMAISGAAVSSNMGSASIGPMAPTLALLNLRLGYWLRNPASTKTSINLLYLIKEAFSLLKPDDRWLYLTDGGHIDNTGIYQLLRRRCSTIIAIDAEADPAMTFGSLVKLQRHARIDLGARITLRWDKIAAATAAVRQTDGAALAGPHCAIGDICYSNGGRGTLIYVKASLTGDENVYVRDYARRNLDFPHETTGDQFFSEEQFEVYRALGFHSVNGLYKPTDRDDAEISVPGVEIRGTIARPADDAVLRPANC